MIMENLRVIREKRGKTQLNVAVAVNVSQEAISAYESGLAYPKVEKLIELAKYLETSTDYLLGLTDDDTQIKYMHSKLSKQERELLNSFIYLKTEDQIKLMGYIDALSVKN